MRLYLIIFVVITISAAATLPESKTLEYENKNDGSGNYIFNFETSNGILRSETGTLVNEGQADAHIEVEGFYSYTDSYGKKVFVVYKADKNGYQIEPDIEPMDISFSPSVTATLLG